jgi:hypothetical protein
VSALAAVVVAATVAGAGSSPLDGNALLAHAAQRSQPPPAYSVPMHFDVHLHRPIPLRFHADATAFYQAPAKQALVITSVPRILRRLVARNYGNLDTVPQNWPAHYHVTSVNRAVVAGVPVFHLDAQPTDDPDLAHVTFDLQTRSLTPVAVQWFYQDGSSIRLVVANEQVGTFLLPRSETITVTMPRIVLDAAGTAGTYTINPAIPAGVFASR